MVAMGGKEAVFRWDCKPVPLPKLRKRQPGRALPASTRGGRRYSTNRVG